ncbi:MAG: hypothetical protein VW268_14610 [Rhodospirillaceae bacterium]
MFKTQFRRLFGPFVIAFLAAAFSPVSAGGVRAADDAVPDLDKIVQAFDTIAFGSEARNAKARTALLN